MRKSQKKQKKRVLVIIFKFKYYRHILYFTCCAYWSVDSLHYCSSMPIPTKPTKQYICTKCAASFQSFAVMQQHETHCTGTTSFVCSFCVPSFVSFKTIAELESHCTEAHALQPTESKNQKDKNVWTCDRCNKKISINDKYDEQQKERHINHCDSLSYNAQCST